MALVKQLLGDDFRGIPGAVFQLKALAHLAQFVGYRAVPHNGHRGQWTVEPTAHDKLAGVKETKTCSLADNPRPSCPFREVPRAGFARPCSLS